MTRGVNGSGFNSSTTSHCSSNNQSISNSNSKKKRDNDDSNDCFDELHLELSFNSVDDDSDDNNNDNENENENETEGEIKWFYQASPRCYNTLFATEINNNTLSPLAVTTNNDEINNNVNVSDEFQLNLRFAFDNAEDSPLSAHLFSSGSKEDKTNAFSFADFINENEKEQKQEQDDEDDDDQNDDQNDDLIIPNNANISEYEEDEEDECDDEVVPKNLLFSFM
eukprot:CAMPEP_0201595580 /NCGR_PEP_ID=MMETSP0190_2-20130828/192532_1 /ASSEMBLY_ACC=CAM_ASM_000263 /TAXON_ID=37353 /ORGANISM="Rosalina sp." /LENGTH=223 /DNA_ID=CAMNT_0048055613 /DNA_START=1864 /DNA_END=2535 /DNA_ORIENTATION=-